MSSTRLNLEQQRKRAKDLRRAHREGRPDAALRIIAHLPRAHRQSAADVLAAPFALSEAQLVVAREAGFTSWPRLKRQVELSSAGLDAAEEALIDAALAGDVSSAPGDRLSIHAAAALGDAPAVARLLDIDPRLATERGGLRGWTPLLYCCFARRQAAGRVEIARRLLALGANPSDEIATFEAPGGFRCALQGAAREVASPELVNLLLDSGAARLASGGTAGPPLALTDAVLGGNLACLERILAAAPDRWERREALEVAVRQDRADMVQVLLDRGAEPSAAGRWWGQGGSCLHAAVLLGRDEAMLNLLLASDVDLARRDRDGRTAYALAVRTDHSVAAELLRARGASDGELDDADRTIAACLRGDREESRRRRPARYRYTDHLMLGWAIGNGRRAAVPLLLEAGLDPRVADPDGETPLHLAARSGDATLALTLQSAGASRDARDFRGNAPFAEPLAPDEQRDRDELFERAADAVAAGDVDTLRGLLDDEPELVRWRSPRDHRATLLIYCGANGTESSRQRSPANAAEVARLLLERGSDANASCRLYGGGAGATTLAMALTSVFTMDTPAEGELVEVLLQGGARLDLWDAPKAALWWAIGWGARRSFAALVAAGLSADDLWLAAAANDVGAIERLLAGGAVVNARTPGGTTPLHAAALMGRTEAAALLLARGADRTARDERWKHTPAEKARWRGHHELARVIAPANSGLTGPRATG